MRRTYNTTADVGAADYLDQTIRLHKGITDIAKRLDSQKNHALTITDIFNPSGEILRMKLKDYCLRLLTKDPVGYGRKTEELLWRKAFYDAVSATKRLRKGNIWNETEKALLSVHLAVGVGFYHHLILKLQIEYSINQVGAMDFAYLQNKSASAPTRRKIPKVPEEVTESVIRLIHRSLVCLGDLARYKLELDPYWDPMIAKRYYKMAIGLKPNIGMPHNQLGTIAGNQNYGLDAVYHYIRCVLCTEPFEGAEGNLKRAIVTHSICNDKNFPTHMCVSRLFSLLQLWDSDFPNSDRINEECQDLLTSIETCLSTEQPESNDTTYNKNKSSIDAYLQGCKIEQTKYLTDDMIFKIVAICLMSISRLKSKESSEVQGVVAITLAIMSQLMQLAITRLQESLIDTPLCNIEGILQSNHLSTPKESKNKSTEEGTKTIKQHKSTGNNKLIPKNDNKSSTKQKHTEKNGDIRNGPRKNRDKPKSLLTKLRRRKRRNSSDTDGSDADHVTVSSSDEINSDVSETEEDVLSEGNVLSDDGLSDDGSDEETLRTKENADNSKDKEMNGHVESEEKTNATDAINHHAENGEHVSNDQAKKEPGGKDPVTNFKDTNNFNNAVEDGNASPDKAIYVALLKKQNLRADQVLNILMRKDILASIKICCDWLRSNPDIVKICGRSSRTLLKRVTILLNLINIDMNTILKISKVDSMILSSVDKLKECVKIVPLPEDADLRGLNILAESHKSLNWKILHEHKMSKSEEVIVRVLKLIDFGHFLHSVEDAGVKYDQTNQQFITVDLKTINAMKDSNREAEMDQSRGKLMRHMGKLWLKAEVCALESRLRSKLISPYLVPDHEVLSKHTPALKRLVYAKKFIIVIPSVVVSALDEVKRISGRAREATRWIEGQLKRGSRFLRAQRPHERLALPYIKGPRPKDKEAWVFFQIIECCHYLTQQMKIGMTNDAETPVVTLLTGCSPDDKKVLTFSPEGLAKSAGVNIEYIETFQTKWRASSKSHG